MSLMFWHPKFGCNCSTINNGGLLWLDETLPFHCVINPQLDKTVCFSSLDIYFFDRSWLLVIMLYICCHPPFPCHEIVFSNFISRSLLLVILVYAATCKLLQLSIAPYIGNIFEMRTLLKPCPLISSTARSAKRAIVVTTVVRVPVPVPVCVHVPVPVPLYGKVF